MRRAPEAFCLSCGVRSVASASATVITMNTTDAPNTQCGWFWSMIQPHWVFGASVVFMVMTVALALATERTPQDKQKASGARLMDP